MLPWICGPSAASLDLEEKEEMRSVHSEKCTPAADNMTHIYATEDVSAHEEEDACEVF